MGLEKCLVVKRSCYANRRIDIIDLRYPEKLWVSMWQPLFLIPASNSGDKILPALWLARLAVEVIYVLD